MIGPAGGDQALVKSSLGLDRQRLHVHRQSRAIDREEDLEGRAPVDHTGQLDPPAVRLDDAVADRQPQAGASADGLGREEQVEDLVADRFGDALASVANAEDNLAFVCGVGTNAISPP
jgi:hypothetical protein